jgi:hypothetical protein
MSKILSTLPQPIKIFTPCGTTHQRLDELSNYFSTIFKKKKPSHRRLIKTILRHNNPPRKGPPSAYIAPNFPQNPSVYSYPPAPYARMADLNHIRIKEEDLKSQEEDFKHQEVDSRLQEKFFKPQKETIKD